MKLPFTKIRTIVSGMGLSRKSEFSYEHINFEMATRHPNEDLRQAIGYKILELRSDSD